MSESSRTRRSWREFPASGEPDSVATLVGMIAEGRTPMEIIADFPQLTADDLRHGMARASDPQMLAKAAADGLTLITADRGGTFGP
ncbi:MAG: DUF433 domain-containing protein [Pseudonocardiaceae bacterium]